MDSHSNRFIIKIFFGIFVSVGLMNIAAAYASDADVAILQSVQAADQSDSKAFVENRAHKKNRKNRHATRR